MCTGVLDHDYVGNLYILLGYPIGPPSKLYEDNQATIKRVLKDRITPQSRTPGILITALHELHPRKKFDMVYTRPNMQPDDLN